MTLHNERYGSDPEYAAAFDEEREKLRTVANGIQEDVGQRQGLMPATAAYIGPAEEIQRVLDNLQDRMLAALDQPYFGRVDYFVLEPGWDSPDEEEGISEEPGFDESNSVYWKPRESFEDRIKRLSKVMYLGVSQIDDHNVYSWTVPAARLWYTNEQGYSAPGGYVDVRTDLKRHLRIRDQQLIDLNDLFRRQLPEGVQTRRELLTEALSGTADGHLSVIVETIEPHQYEAIANSDDKVLVVQGAAGSGKSEIGLHRIAFLLSPFNDLAANEKPTPETTLFVAPSRSFLDYTADLLPALDVRDSVRQITLREWLQSVMSFRMPVQGRIWNDLLDKGEMTKFNENVESFKSSMAMVDAIERHYRSLATQTRKAIESLPAIDVPGYDSISSPPLTIGSSQILQACQDMMPGFNRGSYLNRLRDEFVGRITALVWDTGSYGRRTSGFERLRFRQQILNECILPWCNIVWPRYDARDVYAVMFVDWQHAQTLIKNALSEEDAKELSDSVGQRRTNGFQDSDVAAIAYLDHLLNGTMVGNYRHIVVDEAQDVSPIEFKLLSLNSTNNWFTILGDTAQRLTPYRGVRRWGDLNRVLGRENIKVQEARTSYRSNRYITRFNNRILRLFDRNINAPVPYDREGHRPEYHSHRTREEMFFSITHEVQRIRSLNGLANATIAILARDRTNLNHFQKFCAGRGITDVAAFEAVDPVDSPTILARIPDVKGLEYDAVIVMGVNESFANTIFNQKLLYMATTRAKHYLALHWAGKQSPILHQIYDGGIRKIDHRGRR